MKDQLELKRELHGKEPVQFIDEKLFKKNQKDCFIGVVMWGYGHILDAQNASGIFSERIV